jgi:hypothetical protein
MTLRKFRTRIGLTHVLLQVSKEELAKLVQGFEKQDILTSSGVTLAGNRYIYLSGTERVIRAKLGKVGVHCMKTTQGESVGKERAHRNFSITENISVARVNRPFRKCTNVCDEGVPVLSPTRVPIQDDVRLLPKNVSDTEMYGSAPDLMSNLLMEESEAKRPDNELFMNFLRRDDLIFF